MLNLCFLIHPSRFLTRVFLYGGFLLSVAFVAFAQDEMEDNFDDEDFEESSEVVEEDPSLKDFWKAIRILEIGGGNMAEGKDLLIQAAENEFPPAQYFTGLGYRFGYYGFKESNRKAFS